MTRDFPPVHPGEILSVLMVPHVERVGRVRIISARPVTRNERRIYEEG